MSQGLRIKKSLQLDQRKRSRTAPGFGSRHGKKLAMGLTKAELIEKYKYKVRLIAVKMARDLPPSIDSDDLFSMGFIGLMDAAEKFDPNKGAQFNTYAEFRIRGAIIDGLRQLDWVPRSARLRMSHVRAAADGFEARMGHRPNDREMCHEMKMPLKKFQEMMANLGSQTLMNLEDLPEGIESENSQLLSNPFREVIRNEAKTVVSKMLQKLPEQEQMVLDFYYYRGLTLREIGRIFQITEARVSQIHSRAIHALKAQAKSQVQSVESIFLALIDE